MISRYHSVAPDSVVLAKISSCAGCARRVDLDAAYSYAFTIENLMTSGREMLFFVPHGTNGGAFTLEQIATIEQALAYYGIDLLPLDPNLVPSNNSN